MAETAKRSVICRSRELIERGRGVRFTVRRHGEVTRAFAIRFLGIAHAYLNRCAHRALELDWVEGDFFDAFGEHLLSATHGARHVPASGACVGGGATPFRGEAFSKGGASRHKRRRSLSRLATTAERAVASGGGGPRRGRAG